MVKDWLRTRARAWSGLAIDAVIAAYAVWSVACHAVMLAHGSTYTLAGVMGVCVALTVLGGGLLARRAFQRRKLEPKTGPKSGPKSGPERGAGEGRALDAPTAVPAVREQLVLFALAAAVIALWFVLHDALALWISVVVYLLVACAICLRNELPAAPSARAVPRWQEIVLWCTAALFALLAICVRRWRSDDCYYVNLAVTTADFPWLPLLSVNTIHLPIAGMLGSNSVFVPYRVHTFEALGGLLALVTGSEAIAVMHIGMAGVAAFCIPLAYARLCRLLDPQRWIWMLLVIALWLAVDGSGDRGFANQAFVRAFTGKSVMLNVAIPALAYYGMAFAQRPSLLGFALLVSAQITTVGLSSTGLWMAPMVAMLAVAAPLPLRWKSLRVVLLGLLACVYVIGIALWVRAQLLHAGSAGEPGDAFAVARSDHGANFGLLRSAFEQNIGPARVTGAYFALMLLAVPLCRNALARRYLVVFYLALVLLLMNPYLIDFVRSNLVGRATVQRVLWLAPLPAAIAICFVAAIPNAGATGWQRALGVGAMALGLCALFATIPTRYVLSRRNNVVFHWPPAPKVPGPAFSLVRRLTAKLPPGSLVLAPEMVSWYLPTVRNHSYPLLANMKYMRAPREEEQRRIRLIKRVDGVKAYNQEAHELFEQGIADYAPAAVVLTKRAALHAKQVKVLLRAGYRESGSKDGFRVWFKFPRPTAKTVAPPFAAPSH